MLREGRWIKMTDRTFRSYMHGANSGLTPTLADWQLHLTTLFPEVRLKGYVEVRGSDSVPATMILAQAAIWKGLLYDGPARRAAWDLVKNVSIEDRLAFHREVARSGLRARLAGTPALDLSRELVKLASASLDGDEASHLEPLRNLILVEERTQAEILLDRWAGEWKRDPRRLVSSLSPDPTLQPA